jgi:hypothetical protein
MPSASSIQTRLKSAGLYSGEVDGIIGPQTLTAISVLLDQLNIAPAQLPVPKAGTVVPEEWMPDAKMERVIFHWTAGTHKASEYERGHYHILIEGDGNLVRGIPSISANQAGGGSGSRASHTLNCNTGSIGVSLCCMAGAIERPFNAGEYPLTKEQWDMGSAVVADLCSRYHIAVMPRTVMSHAEVQANLGIHQRQKWDISRLPFDATFDTARRCGDRFRREVINKMAT